MSVTLVLLIASLASYRVTRFLLRDSLIDGTRLRFNGYLIARVDRSRLALKLYELANCPYCISVWTSAGAVWAFDLCGSVPMPVMVWLAVAGGSLMVWRFNE